MWPCGEVSNKGNPAARTYIGTSAATERGMSAWVMRLNMTGTGVFPTSRASTHSMECRQLDQGIKQSELDSPFHTENTVFLHVGGGIVG